METSCDFEQWYTILTWRIYSHSPDLYILCLSLIIIGSTFGTSTLLWGIPPLNGLRVYGSDLVVVIVVVLIRSGLDPTTHRIMSEHSYLVPSVPSSSVHTFKLVYKTRKDKWLPCTFRASCYSTRLSWALVLAKTRMESLGRVLATTTCV